MATVLRTQKALMTRRINAISQWIQDTAPLLERPTDGEQRRRAHQYRMILSTCEEHIERLEASLNTLAAAFDNTDATSPDEEEFKKYIDNAMDFVMTLHEHKDKVSAVIHETSANPQDTDSEEGRTCLLQPSQLPPIPIPTFTGRRWEWDNFWALFEANVHKQALTPLQKFNYLHSSLAGEAKQSIARFQVTAANYSRALDHLKKRYGQSDGIILDLHKSLKACSTASPKIECQRQLFEQLAAIVAQLRDHGEHVDSYLMVQTVLQKFHSRIQTSALERNLRNGTHPTQWTLDT
ncbi:hypothetical protein Q1695_012396 [Nippostrongylus brasiliensis]|nr:hypothetical protein Q1695_012396 [Nippostrongylus brasiliensis]